jgi:hypothetical protein
MSTQQLICDTGLRRCSKYESLQVSSLLRYLFRGRIGNKGNRDDGDSFKKAENENFFLKRSLDEHKIEFARELDSDVLAQNREVQFIILQMFDL